jgi:hypothetical protein
MSGPDAGFCRRILPRHGARSGPLGTLHDVVRVGCYQWGASHENHDCAHQNCCCHDFLNQGTFLPLNCPPEAQGPRVDMRKPPHDTPPSHDSRICFTPRACIVGVLLIGFELLTLLKMMSLVQSDLWRFRDECPFSDDPRCETSEDAGLVLRRRPDSCYPILACLRFLRLRDCPPHGDRRRSP